MMQTKLLASKGLKVSKMESMVTLGPAWRSLQAHHHYLYRPIPEYGILPLKKEIGVGVIRSLVQATSKYEFLLSFIYKKEA